MWEVVGRTVPADRFRPFEPTEVLYDFDGPRTFTLLDSDRELNLAHWVDEDRTVARYIVVPFDEDLLGRMKAGQITVREALDQPRVYVVDIGPGAAVRSAWRVNLADLPPDALPRPTTMLWPSLEPIASIRAIGEKIQPGAIPPNVVRSVADSLPRASRTVLDYVFNALPPELIEMVKARDFEPVAQRFSVASFEISFRMPAIPPDLFDGEDGSARRRVQASIERAGKLLRTGLDWATSDSPTQTRLRQLVASDDEERVILEALDNLMPSGRGPIQQMELRGAWVGAPTRPLLLTRDNRRAVSGALRQLPARLPARVRLTGRIRELDRDALTFDLREIVEGDRPTMRFVFDDFLLDDVEEAFDEEIFVRVSGIQVAANRPTQALEIRRVDG